MGISSQGSLEKSNANLNSTNSKLGSNINLIQQLNAYKLDTNIQPSHLNKQEKVTKSLTSLKLCKDNAYNSDILSCSSLVPFKKRKQGEDYVKKIIKQKAKTTSITQKLLYINSIQKNQTSFENLKLDIYRLDTLSEVQDSSSYMFITNLSATKLYTCSQIADLKLTQQIGKIINDNQ
uniref:Uncharacterized protein n=1 Tax=Spironucleus salmonicida TaxID=348837 RepID=V6LXW5_9EUKA|eukprot:EST45649.1 Hypothetical protein SS50377_14221 [Spironucleus salmonicida]